VTYFGIEKWRWKNDLVFLVYFEIIHEKLFCQNRLIAMDISLVKYSDGSRSKVFDPGRVRSVFCSSGQVGWAIYGSGLNLENFPQTMSNFLFFFLSGQKKSLRVGSERTLVKGRSASYLLRVKSKLGSGQGPSLVKYIKFTIRLILLGVALTKYN